MAVFDINIYNPNYIEQCCEETIITIYDYCNDAIAESIYQASLNGIYESNLITLNEGFFGWIVDKIKELARKIKEWWHNLVHKKEKDGDSKEEIDAAKEAEKEAGKAADDAVKGVEKAAAENPQTSEGTEKVKSAAAEQTEDLKKKNIKLKGMLLKRKAKDNNDKQNKNPKDNNPQSSSDNSQPNSKSADNTQPSPDKKKHLSNQEKREIRMTAEDGKSKYTENDFPDPKLKKSYDDEIDSLKKKCLTGEFDGSEFGEKIKSVQTKYKLLISKNNKKGSNTATKQKSSNPDTKKNLINSSNNLSEYISNGKKKTEYIKAYNRINKSRKSKADINTAKQQLNMSYSNYIEI